MKSVIALLFASTLFQVALSGLIIPDTNKDMDHSSHRHQNKWNKRYRPPPECVKELCNLVLDGESEDPFDDVYNFGDVCSCNRDAISVTCRKQRTIEEGQVEAKDNWICRKRVPQLLS